MNTDWEFKKLDEVCCIRPAKSEVRTKLQNADLVSFVPMEYLGIDHKHFDSHLTKSLKEVEGSYTYFGDGDVLLAKITPCFENGKLGIAKNLINGIGFGSSEYIVFRADNSLFNEYLYYFLSQKQFREEGARRMVGAVGHKRVSKEFIENHLIPLPPLVEQQRIVAILDEAFAAINKAKDNVEKNLENSHELFESFLSKIFAKPGDGWEVCKIEDYIKFIDYRGRTPEKTTTGLRLITAKNVKNGFLQTSPEEFVDPAIYDSWMTRGIPETGDVLFTTEAPLANVAQLETVEKVVFAQRIIIFQPQTGKINKKFLKYILLSKPIRHKILTCGTGATVQGIKASLLKKIEIYFPKSVTEQQRIVTKLDALSFETKRLESIYQKKLADLDEMKKSILQRAFNGTFTEA